MKKNKAKIIKKLQFHKESNKSNMMGLSPTNLKKCREFYLAYIEIQQPMPVESFLTN